MFRKVLDWFRLNRPLALLCLMIYVCFVGPFLISANSTELVVLGIVILGLLILWFKTAFKGVIK